MTGRAVVEALVPRGYEVFVSEARFLSQEERGFLRGLGASWEEGGHTERALEADLVIPSPGVPDWHPLLRKAGSLGIPVWSEIELSFRLARPQRIIAVTGTNGKSTTTDLVGAILRESGLAPVVAGNIGLPAISTVEEVAGRPWVLEVSSYQLRWVREFRPTVAVWLNFAPDHLDHHGSLAAYFAAKAALISRQREGDVAVLPPELIAQIAPRGEVVDYTRVELPPGWGEGLPVHLVSDLKAAWAAALAAYPELRGHPPDFASLAGALRQPHRLEVVGELEGVTFIDDSKATNAHATCAALEAISAPVVLILGGRHKGGGYETLRPLLEEKVRYCVLIGESQRFFSELLSGWGIPYGLSSDPASALREAFSHAERGDVVLLSPACASFDQFSNYAHRGDEFQRAFGQLSRRGRPTVPGI